MYQPLAILVSLCLTTVSQAAAVTTTTTSAAAALQTDTYDDLSAGLPVVGLQNPVGIYHGAEYFGWVVAGPSTPLTGTEHGGVLPQSPPNSAIANPPTNMSAPSIAAHSPYKTFDLLSFYFACNLFDAQGAADAAQGCVISVNGYYPDGNQTGVATYGFADFNPTAAPMVKALLPLTFWGVQNVTFGVASSASTPSTTNILIDNVVRVNHK